MLVMGDITNHFIISLPFYLCTLICLSHYTVYLDIISLGIFETSLLLCFKRQIIIRLFLCTHPRPYYGDTLSFRGGSII